MLRLQGQALQQLAQLPGATAGSALAHPHGQAALGGPVALRPLGTHTLGCRGPTLPPAVTQLMLLGFNPFDVMMTPGMQAAVWGKKQQNEASCNTHTPTPQQGLPSPHLQRATRVLPSHPTFISLVILPTNIQAGSGCPLLEV